MTLPVVSPVEASRLMREGAVLVDVREADERLRMAIPGSLHRPLSALGGTMTAPAGGVVLFHCKSGARTAGLAAKLAAEAEGCTAYVVSGGIDAWKAAGLPVVVNHDAPLEIMRQVQLAAGALILAGVILGTTVHAGFYGITAFVGAGLMFAGATGFCGMARLLAAMPWNRPARLS